MTITRTINLLLLMRREVLGESIDSPPTNEEYAEALQSAIDKLTSHPLSDPSFEPLENSVL